MVILGLLPGQASGQGAERKKIVEIEFHSSPTPLELASRIVDTARKCWLKKLPGFTNLILLPVGPYPGLDGFRIHLKDPKRTERYAQINVVPASNSSGYIVQTVQRGDGVDIDAAVKRLMDQVEEEHIYRMTQKLVPC